MRSAHTLVMALAVCVPQGVMSAEADRSTPVAAFRSLHAAHLDGNLTALAESMTADSQEQLAVAALAQLMNVRKRLNAGPPSLRTAVWEIDRYLAEQGLAEKQWVAATVVASHRRQSSGFLVVALALQNVKHWPRFAAGAQQLLVKIAEDYHLPHNTATDDVDPWQKFRVVEVAIDGQEAQLTVASATNGDERALRFRKVGEEWLYACLQPLPHNVAAIVHPTDDDLVVPPPSGIVVDDATSSSPEAVYALAKDALAKEDYRALAKCLTADSLEGNAVTMLLQAHVALRKEELRDSDRQRVKQAFHTCGIGEDAVQTEFLAAAATVFEHGDGETAREAAADVYPHLAALIDDKPQFCAEVQIALFPIEHGHGLYELFHLRHLVAVLGKQLQGAQISGDAAVGTVLLENSQTRRLQFVHTADGWRIALPVPLGAVKTPLTPD